MKITFEQHALWDLLTPKHTQWLRSLDQENYYRILRTIEHDIEECGMTYEEAIKRVFGEEKTT